MIIKGISHDHELRNQLSSTHTHFIAFLESDNTYQLISITISAQFEYLQKNDDYVYFGISV